MAITWTIRYTNNLISDMIDLLNGLKNHGPKISGALTPLIDGKGSPVPPYRKNDAINILKNIKYVDSEKQGNTYSYQINEWGLNYLNSIADSSKDNNYILHSSLYQNILHYQYAYNFILENDFYEFRKKEFIENLVINSFNEFGTRLYDWDSGDNVIGFMRDLGILKKINKHYSIEENYRKKFDQDNFIKVIKRYMNQYEMQETFNLCKHLIDNSNEFLLSNEQISIDFMYKHLLKLNKDKKILKFIPGIPTPPIPNNHTIVKLKNSK